MRSSLSAYPVPDDFSQRKSSDGRWLAGEARGSSTGSLRSQLTPAGYRSPIRLIRPSTHSRSMIESLPMAAPPFAVQAGRLAAAPMSQMLS